MNINDLKKKRAAFFTIYKSKWVFPPGSDEEYLWCKEIDYLSEAEQNAVLDQMEKNHDFNNPKAERPAIPQLKRAVAQVKTELGAKNAFSQSCKVCYGNKGWLMTDYIKTVNGMEPCRNGTQGARVISVPCQCELGDKNRELHKIPKTEFQEKVYAYFVEKQKLNKPMKPEEFLILKERFDSELEEISKRASHFKNSGRSERYDPKIEKLEAVSCL